MHSDIDANNRPLRSHFTNVDDIQLMSMRDVLRTIGSVRAWCERYGAELGHEAARSAQVARMITLGCGGRLAVWGTTTVPQEEHGTRWIAFAAEYGFDLETYGRL